MLENKRRERERDRERERMKREEGGLREMKIERMKKDVDKNVAASLATGKLPSRDREMEKNVGEREKGTARE